MHRFQVFGVKTGSGVQIFNEIRSRSWSHFFGTRAGAGVKKSDSDHLWSGQRWMHSKIVPVELLPLIAKYTF